MKETKDICKYPGCKEEVRAAFPLSLTNEKNANVEYPLCWYHYYVVAGNHFQAKKTGEWDFEIVGPTDTVSLIEQVMAAKMMIEKIKEDEAKNESKK